MGLIMGDALSTYLVGKSGTDNPKISPVMLYSGCGIITMVTGLFNWILFAPKKTMKPGNAKMYTAMVHSKLLVVLLIYTPISKKFMDEAMLVQVKAAVTFGLVLLAAKMRFYREESVKQKNQ